MSDACRCGNRWSFLVAVASAAAVAACAVGPRYHPPAERAPAAFAEADAASFDVSKSPASALWHSFGDPVLDRLIGRALARNSTLAETLAQVNEARALRGLEFYALVPTVTADASRTHSTASRFDPFVPPGVGATTVFKAGFDASWEIDLFGGALSARRAADAALAASEASLDAARQAVVAEVAQAYFMLRAEQSRLQVLERNVENLAENQRLLEARRDAGRSTELDVARARALQLSAVARVPQTRAAITRAEQRLTVLVVEPIDALRSDLGPPRALPTMPAMVAVGSPRDWLRRRPDIRAAERQLASATARIGIDAADFLPQLTLVGGFGWTGQLASQLGRKAAQRSDYGPSLSWSFLDVGRVRQRLLASEARAAGSLAAYDSTVLLALEETENALAGYRLSNEAAVTLELAVAAARAATRLAQQRFEAGAADTLTVLDAERTQLDLEDQLATGESQRATSLAALYKALVGDFAKAE